MKYLLLLILMFPYIVSAQNESPPDTAKKEIPQSLGDPLSQDTGRKELFEFVQEVPQPKINLNEFFAENLHYPALAAREKISGIVWVKCLILENGSIDRSTIQVAKGIKGHDGGLNAEALRLVKLIPDGSFTPGTNNGTPVKVWISMPVKFTAPGPEKKKRKFKKGKT